ncbi:HipA domain-containing protein [Nocardia sp. NPDC049190]|uniref:type II toxin-antitoxin system HipA family toxin n=1 Tax=Nocardia sp. NPDC049190 TaxID=3155650 RepID=UPI0033F1A8DC
MAAVLESAKVSPDPRTREHQPWKFSLAGVGLKFSTLRDGRRFTCTATGEGGDWILKLPDSRFSAVPSNEYTMMRFAGTVGIDVPEVALVHRDDIDGVPSGVWPGGEEFAYAVKRFDRATDRRLVHIEDFAQVRAVYPISKYEGNFETVAALAYRGRDTAALHEFVRRLVFFVLIGNGDAHLKNWSLIYRDRRVPTLSPAYDIMSTEAYGIGDGPEDLGLKFVGNKRFDAMRVYQFDRLARKLHTSATLSATALETIDRVRQHWPRFADELEDNASVRDCVDRTITMRTASLTRNR